MHDDQSAGGGFGIVCRGDVEWQNRPVLALRQVPLIVGAMETSPDRSATHGPTAAKCRPARSAIAVGQNLPVSACPQNLTAVPEGEATKSARKQSRTVRVPPGCFVSPQSQSPGCLTSPNARPTSRHRPLSLRSASRYRRSPSSANDTAGCTSDTRGHRPVWLRRWGRSES